MASPAHHSGGGGGRYGDSGGGGYSGRQMTTNDRSLEGKRIQIKRGPNRGMWGLIKSATATHLRMELEAQQQTISIDRKFLDLDSGSNGPRASRNMGMGMGMGRGGYAVGMGAGYGAQAAPGGRTPAHYSSGYGGGGVTATPAHYSSIPSATPVHPGFGGAVTKTPAYDPAWAATPAHPGFGGGSVDDDIPQTIPGYGVLPSIMRPGESAGGIGSGPGQGPVPGTSAQDWKGLEVEMSSGDVAVVRSVGSDGQASVQTGELLGNSSYVFTNGSVHSIPVRELKLVKPGKGDKVRILSGDVFGKEGVINVLEAGEAYVFTDSGMVMAKVDSCAKVAE